MAYENVMAYFESAGLGERVMKFERSSATVEEAARAVGCEPKQIAKTMSFLVGENPVLIVTAGDVKVDNKKFKSVFQQKAKMIAGDQVESYIGHAPGGVCPFVIKPGVRVYLDVSLKRFDKVYPAGGNGYSAVELSLGELEEHSHYLQWVDVCSGWTVSKGAGQMEQIEMIHLLKDRFHIEAKRQDRGGVYALTQRKLAYNSNRIEGSTLTEKQTASIFETGTIRADGRVFRTKDVEEMTGHFTMFNYMLETCEDKLSQELIKAYHYRLKAGVFEDIANGYPIGEYKNRRNMVSEITTSSPENVEEDMRLLLEHYHEKELHDLKDLAEFHAMFEKIHPFADGNGRAGRLLLFKECLRSSVMPFIIGEDRKSEYYECLNNAQQNGEYGTLIRFFEQEQEKYAEMVKDFICPAKKI